MVQGEAYAVANSTMGEQPFSVDTPSKLSSTPEPQWQARGKRRLSQECQLETPEPAMWTGCAIVISPIVASRWLSERAAFGFSAAVSVLNATQLLLSFKETLAPSEQVGSHRRTGSHPTNTGHLPLSYSGNPGVSVSSRGVRMAQLTARGDRCPLTGSSATHSPSSSSLAT